MAGKFSAVHQKWVSLYTNGLSIGEIAKQYSANHANVRYAIVRAGVPLRPRLTPKERYNKYVIKQDGCWGWSGSTSEGGYPILGINGKTIIATRLSYLIHNKAEPGDLLVCHTCDNPICTNPKHLFLGTHQANTLDRIAKGRRGKRLSTDEVLKIKGLIDTKTSIKIIAEEYGVTASTIQRIKSKKAHTAIIMNNPVFRQFKMRMSKDKMADVLYAIIMCKAEITSTHGIGIYAYDRSQNAHNEVNIMIKIAEKEMEYFEFLANVTLHGPHKVHIN